MRATIGECGFCSICFSVVSVYCSVQNIESTKVKPRRKCRLCSVKSRSSSDYWLASGQPVASGHTLLSIFKDYICRNKAHLLSHVTKTTLGNQMFRDQNLYWVCELKFDSKCKSVTEWSSRSSKNKEGSRKNWRLCIKNARFSCCTFLVGAHFHGTLFLYMQFYMVHVCTFSKGALFFSSKSCPEGRPDSTFLNSSLARTNK